MTTSSSDSPNGPDRKSMKFEGENYSFGMPVADIIEKKGAPAVLKELCRTLMKNSYCTVPSALESISSFDLDHLIGIWQEEVNQAKVKAGTADSNLKIVEMGPGGLGTIIVLAFLLAQAETTAYPPMTLEQSLQVSLLATFLKLEFVRREANEFISVDTSKLTLSLDFFNQDFREVVKAKTKEGQKIEVSCWTTWREMRTNEVFADVFLKAPPPFEADYEKPTELVGDSTEAREIPPVEGGGAENDVFAEFNKLLKGKK